MRLTLGNPYVLVLVLLIGVAVMASIAIPGLIESPRWGNEKAAIATLRSVISSGEVQARLAKLADADGDGAGEYLPLADLVRHGLVVAKAPPEADGTLTIGAYRYAVHLPDGLVEAPSATAAAMADATATGAATADPTETPSATAALAQAPTPSATAAATTGGRERHYVVYAWPIDRERGLRQFAVDERGIVYQRMIDAPTTAPAWDALYDGRGWGAEPMKPWWPVRQ